MNFAAYIERHARSIILVALALAIAGVVSAISLPVGLFPQVAFPRVVVDLDAGSRPADQTALLVTFSVVISSRLAVSQIRTVPSWLAVARRLPSGENAALFTVISCPVSVASWLPRQRFHR